MVILQNDPDGNDDFPIRCQCTLCGPVAGAGRQCAVQLSVVACHFSYFGVHSGLRRGHGFYMCEDCKIKYIIGFTVSRTCEDCASPDIEAMYCMEMKWRRLGRLVIKRWLYFVRWKKMDRVLALYLGRLIWNPQIWLHIAGFAA